jgi:putative membrane protein
MSSGTPAGRSTLDAATRLAVERTRLAYERTLMAWVRTAAATITLGFTMYKYFEFERTGVTTPARQVWLGPRAFALLMIGIGVGTLTLGLVQHRGSLAALRDEYGTAMPSSTATITALLFIALGLITIAAVLFRQ